MFIIPNDMLIWVFKENHYIATMAFYNWDTLLINQVTATVYAFYIEHDEYPYALHSFFYRIKHFFTIAKGILRMKTYCSGIRTFPLISCQSMGFLFFIDIRSQDYEWISEEA